MNILCIDIGGGTQDICYYESGDVFENSFKMVLPTPAKRLAGRIRALNKDLFVSGTIIGGGVSQALKEKIDAGFDVFISRKSAPTIKDNIEYVKKKGFLVVEEVMYPDIILNEFDDDIIFPAAEKSLVNFNPDIIAAAVQDHGYIENQSDRVTRFNFLKEFLKSGLEKAYFNNLSDIPEYMTRFRAIYESILAKYPDKNIAVTDTAIIACLGASYGVDEDKPFITVDIGNCHTFAAAFDENRNLLGFFEHHTDSLSRESLIKYLRQLALGTISHEEIFNNDGHGAYINTPKNIEGAEIYLTGPNRNRFFTEDDKNIVFANPKGDTMMTGPIGMIIQQGISI